ncbi:MAG: NADH-quinone oxidoreductase subunit J [Cyclobacteriaceae bacterium]
MACLGIVFTNNVIHAAFMLVLVLVSFAGLYVLLNAEFLAVVQLLIYAGGVLVLMIFGIMLTNRPENGKMLTGHHLIFPGIVSAVGFLLIMLFVYQKTDMELQVGERVEKQVSLIGISFMTEYLLAFELVAYLLLVVLIGAGYYAKSSRR